MQFHRRRRLVGDWSDVEANRDYDQAMVQILKILELKKAGNVALQVLPEIMFNPETDYFGPFVGFTDHNYLYGFNGRKVVADVYEVLRNRKHPEFKAMWTDIKDVRAWAIQNQGLSIEEFAAQLGERFGLLAPLKIAAMPDDAEFTLQQGARVFLVLSSLLNQAGLIDAANGAAWYQVPIAILGQWAVSGWKKTAWTWGVGIGLTEVVSASSKMQISGWSIITYGVFGHFFMEIYKRPKLLKIMNLFKYPEFITLGIGGVGTWQAVSSFIADPGWPAGEKLGIVHAFHHMGILYGAWLNR